MKLTLDHAARQYVNWTPEELAAAGVPQAMIDAATLGLRAKAIGAACKARIYAVASPEAQMNMAATSAVISGKTSAARSDPEKAILAGAEAAIGWVAAMRGAVVALAADPAADFTADAAWPDVPADALAMIANF